MGLLVTNIRLPFDRPEEEAIAAARRQAGLTGAETAARVYRVSLDARHGRVSRVYTVRLDAPFDEEAFAEKLQMPFLRFQANERPVVQPGRNDLPHRPVVIGLGPAGLFAAYMLSQYGYAPLVLERGGTLEERDQATAVFQAGGKLDTDCHILFGEGGAGAYSDGKLTTRISDPLCTEVLELLAAHGAPAEILKLARPHIGTDLLKTVVRRIRCAIEENGGTVLFHTALTGISCRNGRLQAVLAGQEEIPCERAILAIGHSARDTFQALYQNGLPFEPKAFSVGVRIEHLQKEIDHAMYGKFAGHPLLPPAEYNLSRRAGGRACYSFCMCPGGVVVAAQSEENTIVTNGMSYHRRDGVNANAALAVSVEPADFADGTPFGGIALQRQIERAAFAQTGSYRAPCQRVGDFLSDRPGRHCGSVKPTYPIGVVYGEAAGSLPVFVQQMLRDSLPYFGQKIQGFDAPDALLTGPETRTSSPVRIPRGADLFPVGCQGLIPCGEGAGYAGGILSAAVDGIRAAYCIIREYAPAPSGGKEKK